MKRVIYKTSFLVSNFLQPSFYRWNRDAGFFLEKNFVLVSRWDVWSAVAYVAEGNSKESYSLFDDFGRALREQGDSVGLDKGADGWCVRQQEYLSHVHQYGDRHSTDGLVVPCSQIYRQLLGSEYVARNPTHADGFNMSWGKWMCRGETTDKTEWRLTGMLANILQIR